MIYLDNAATTMNKPQAVIDAVCGAMTSFGGPGRGSHQAALDASLAVFEARQAVSGLLGAWGAGSVSFALNATMALNIAIDGLLPAGGVAVTTAASHNSVLRPLNRARDERGCQVRVAAILPDGSLDWESYERALVGASLVVATHASNVTGDVYDIERMAAFARKADALFVLDAAQTAGAWAFSASGIGADVVSGCELATALSAGLSPEGIYFHGNNKTPFELEFAVKSGVHAVVIDSFYEIGLLDKLCASLGKRINALVRVNPGIDAHTHHFIQTTRVDSKFGFSIADGTAIKAIKAVINCENVDFAGIHCHIGSQIFELKPFELAVEKMTDFIVKINSELKVDVAELNLGGGYGVRYTDEDKPLKPQEYVGAIVAKLKECIVNFKKTF
mgnify:CR=1 FL=1